nr:FkbM family methyltransferase [Candidatus Omnitrophota bacterium]
MRSDFEKDFIHASVAQNSGKEWPVYTFPDGFRCYSHAGQLETELIYKEIVKDKEYLKHGISIKDGDCIFDVGANIGIFTLLLGTLYSNLSIYAFEPVPQTFRVLQANVQLQALQHVDLYNFGLSSEDRKGVEFAYYVNMPGNSTTRPEEKEYQIEAARSFYTDEQIKFLSQYERTTVEMRTLSSFLEEKKVKRIDLLKIDVEGNEQEVLKGIQDKHWELIRQMVVEVHNANRYMQDLVAILKEKDLSLSAEGGITDSLGNANLYCIRK